jgi:carbamoyl-phosphate synthase large subunit
MPTFPSRSSIRILLSSAGRRVELAECFRQAAKDLEIDLWIVAADMSPEWSPACQVADAAIAVPGCLQPDFHDRIADICQSQAIDLIVPTIDTELLGYAQNRQRFRETGTDTVVASEVFIRLARNKRLTMETLPRYGIDVPETWTWEDRHSRFSYPLIAKPVDGSCSQGIRLIGSAKDLEKYGDGFTGYLFQELCSGNEYTVNCYYEQNQCRCAIPHRRVKTRTGEVLFAETERVAVLEEAAQKMAAIPGIDGPLCFQAFYDPQTGRCQVIEINARFGGGYPICDYAGGRFALWLLQKRLAGVSQAHNQWTAGVRMLRYDAAVFYP